MRRPSIVRLQLYGIALLWAFAGTIALADHLRGPSVAAPGHVLQTSAGAPP